jgi:hypothetical protein
MEDDHDLRGVQRVQREDDSNAPGNAVPGDIGAASGFYWHARFDDTGLCGNVRVPGQLSGLRACAEQELSFYCRRRCHWRTRIRSRVYALRWACRRNRGRGRRRAASNKLLRSGDTAHRRTITLPVPEKGRSSDLRRVHGSCRQKPYGCGQAEVSSATT